MQNVMPSCQCENIFFPYALQKHGMQILYVGYLAVLWLLQTVQYWVTDG